MEAANVFLIASPSEASPDLLFVEGERTGPALGGDESAEKAGLKVTSAVGMRLYGERPAES
jgi:hypothetical protein